MNLAERRPRIFIGSSTEGKKFADQMSVHLSENELEPMPWFEFFKTGRPPLQELEKISLEIDGAILIGSADDRALIRNSKFTQMRDNVLFEYGLLSGHLGRSKCALLLPDLDDFRLPSDLLGLGCFALYGSERFGQSAASVIAGLKLVVRKEFLPESTVTKARRLLLLVGWVRDNIARSVTEFYGAPSRTLFAQKLEGISEFVRKDIDELLLRAEYDAVVECIKKANRNFPGFPSFDDARLRGLEGSRVLDAIAEGTRPDRMVLDHLMQYPHQRDEHCGSHCKIRGKKTDCRLGWRDWWSRTHHTDSGWRDRLFAERYGGKHICYLYFIWAEGAAEATTMLERHISRQIDEFRSEARRLQHWLEYHSSEVNASITSFERKLHETLFGKL
jgi:hypothetical protein